MGKNTSKPNYETVVQLLVLAAAILTPFFAFNFMDLELFSVSTTMVTTLSSSIKPWLCPPYVYLLIIFIIFFIVASSFIRSNPIVFDPTTDHDDSFIESYLVCQSDHRPGSFSGEDLALNLPTSDMVKDRRDNHGEGRPKEVVPETTTGVVDNGLPEKTESVVDKRELRKSKTFHEGTSAHLGRRERYVRILNQEELDRRVKAFIHKCKKDNNVKNQNSGL